MIAPDRIRLTGSPATFPQMIFPRPLPRGATIGIAAISGRVNLEMLDRGRAYLEGKGYRVIEASNTREVFRDFAGTDDHRAGGYLELVRAPEVDAIIFARGGWGAARILGKLDPELLRSHPKIQMGGSDLTSLFSFLNQRCGLVCFHGPMVATAFAKIPVDGETDRSWPEVLSGSAEPWAFGPDNVINAGSGEGPVTGGCLSIILSLEGTPDALETAGRVLFLEDVREEIYRIDRMLSQLKRAGHLEGPAGVIIGSLEEITRHGQSDEEMLVALLREYFGGVSYPVVRGFPAGHGRTNRVLPLGVPVRLDTGAGQMSLSLPGPV